MPSHGQGVTVSILGVFLTHVATFRYGPVKESNGDTYVFVSPGKEALIAAVLSLTAV